MTQHGKFKWNIILLCIHVESWVFCGQLQILFVFSCNHHTLQEKYHAWILHIPLSYEMLKSYVSFSFISVSLELSVIMPSVVHFLAARFIYVYFSEIQMNVHHLYKILQIFVNEHIHLLLCITRNWLILLIDFYPAVKI